MDRRLENLRRQADALWSSTRFSSLEAAKLAAELIKADYNPDLSGSAKQALQSLRKAAAPKAGELEKCVARRRFGLLRTELHRMRESPFGKGGRRTSREASEASLYFEQRKRLGLPSHGQLRGPDITAAYRRVVRSAHPDAGGDPAAFMEVVRARDTLLQALKGAVRF